MMVILKDREALAVAKEDGELLWAADNANGHEVKNWWLHGVPGLRGVVSDSEAREEEMIVEPDDALFKLAVLEEVERRGWTIEESHGQSD